MPRISNAREDILIAAHTLFWCNSYEAIGVEAICRKASVKKGSFYHFFPSKEDVALTLLDRLHAKAQDELLAPAFAGDAAPYARFGRFLERLEQHAAKDGGNPENGGRFPGCPIGNLVLELSTQSERLRQKLDEIILTYIGFFTRTIQEAKARGELKPEADPAHLAELIAAAWQGGILLAKAHNEPQLGVRVFRQALECAFAANAQRR